MCECLTWCLCNLRKLGSRCNLNLFTEALKSLKWQFFSLTGVGCYNFHFFLNIFEKNPVDSLALFFKTPSENNYISVVEVFTLMTYENPWLSVWAYLLYSHYSSLPGFTLQTLSPLDQLSRLLDWCWEIDVCPLRGCVHIWGLGVRFLFTHSDSNTHVNLHTHKQTLTKGGWVKLVMQTQFWTHIPAASC